LGLRRLSDERAAQVVDAERLGDHGGDGVGDVLLDLRPDDGTAGNASPASSAIVS
jgi:hypothetical protein